MSSITASFKKSYWNFMICYFYTQYFHSAQDVVQAFYNPLYKSPKCQLVCRKANWIAWLSSVNSDYICFTFFLYGSQRSKQNPQFESLSNLNKQFISLKKININSSAGILRRNVMNLVMLQNCDQPKQLNIHVPSVKQLDNTQSTLFSLRINGFNLQTFLHPWLRILQFNSVLIHKTRKVSCFNIAKKTKENCLRSHIQNIELNIFQKKS